MNNSDNNSTPKADFSGKYAHSRLPKADSATNYAEDIARACEVMRRGGVILYPTDTIWGIGCDASNSKAVRRVFEIKRRADSKALIILTDSVDSLRRYVENVPEVAEQLIEATDRPITIIYDHARGIAPEAVAEDGSVAVRVTGEEFSKALCRKFNRPLVSTSANVSGAPSPATFSEISEEIKQQVDYIVEARRNENRPASPSLIIKISDDCSFKILRS